MTERVALSASAYDRYVFDSEPAIQSDPRAHLLEIHGFFWSRTGHFVAFSLGLCKLEFDLIPELSQFILHKFIHIFLLVNDLVE